MTMDITGTGIMDITAWALEATCWVPLEGRQGSSQVCSGLSLGGVGEVRAKNLAMRR